MLKAVRLEREEGGKEVIIVWFMYVYGYARRRWWFSLYLFPVCILCMREGVCILDYVEKLYASLHLAIHAVFQALLGCNLRGCMERAQA